jgi:hypothetical protein
MIVKVLGYKISLEIIILMLVIYLVMIVHSLASCCNAEAISEGFSDMVKPKMGIDALKKKLKNARYGGVKMDPSDFIQNKKLVENIII